MHTIRVSERTGKDGALLLRIPLDKPDAEYDVILIVQPKATSATTPPDPGWPPGYFDSTYGSIDDDTFFRHPQGELPKSVDLD